jgi:hypothetical protein
MASIKVHALDLACRHVLCTPVASNSQAPETHPPQVLLQHPGRFGLALGCRYLGISAHLPSPNVRAPMCYGLQTGPTTLATLHPHIQ